MFNHVTLAALACVAGAAFSLPSCVGGLPASAPQTVATTNVVSPEPRVPAAITGTFTVTVTDSSGRHVAGTCRVYDGTGKDVSAPFLVRNGGTSRQGKIGELLADGTNEFTGVLPPGVYELDFEFVDHGTQQQLVTIRAREVSDVRLRLP